LTIGSRVVTTTQRYLASNIFHDLVNHTDTEQGVVVTTQTQVGKSWSGADDPLWRVKIANKADATNTYVANHYFVHQVLPTFMVGRTSGDSFGYRSYSYDRAFVGSLTVDQADVNACTNEAQIRLNKKLLKVVQSVDGIAFLGELTETFHLLRHPTEIFVKLTEAHARNLMYHKRRFINAHKRLSVSRRFKTNEARLRARSELITRERRLASDLWLQYSFGIRPLVNDIQSAVEAITEKNMTGIEVTTGTSTIDSQSVVETPLTEFNSNLTIKTVTLQVTNVKLTARTDLTAFYNGLSATERLKKQFTLDLTAIAPALWDLTPLSVFIDMFVNVNDVLKAGATILPKHNTTRRLTVNRMVYTETIPKSFGNAAFFTAAPKTGKTSVSTRHYERAKWADVIPTLTFTLPLSKPLQLGSLLAFVNSALI